MSLDVQLEFEFTRKGYLQERAILQDQYLRDVYDMFTYHTGFQYKSFEQFELEDGVFYMKKFSEQYPNDDSYIRSLL